MDRIEKGDLVVLPDGKYYTVTSTPVRGDGVYLTRFVTYFELNKNGFRRMDDMKIKIEDTPFWMKPHEEEKEAVIEKSIDELEQIKKYVSNVTQQEWRAQASEFGIEETDKDKYRGFEIGFRDGVSRACTRMVHAYIQPTPSHETRSQESSDSSHH